MFMLLHFFAARKYGLKKQEPSSQSKPIRDKRSVAELTFPLGEHCLCNNGGIESRLEGVA